MQRPDDPAPDTSRTLPTPVVWLIGSGLALLVILASSRGDVERMTYGDGAIYLNIASHLTTPPEEIVDIVAERGPSARYGRIGLPVIVWALSLGRNAAMLYVQPLVVAVAAGAAAAATAVLLRNGPPLTGLLAFAVPGYVLAVSGGYAEALAVPFALWAIAFALRARWWVASGLLAAAMLTKENAGSVLLVLVGVALWNRRGKPAAILLASLAPLLAWYLFVRERFGHFPVLDPYFRETTTTIGPPVRALFDSLVSPDAAASAVMAGIHLALALVAIALIRRNRFALFAAVASLQLLTAGPFAWHYLGDAARISSFIEFFAMLAVVAALRPGWPRAGVVYGRDDEASDPLRAPA